MNYNPFFLIKKTILSNWTSSGIVKLLPMMFENWSNCHFNCSKLEHLKRDIAEMEGTNHPNNYCRFKSKRDIDKSLMCSKYQG
jgi:hypothetical protein